MACHACGREQITDSELRDRLRQLGVSPGPITDSTRSVYHHKLRALTGSNGAPPGPPESKKPEFRSRKSSASVCPSVPRPPRASTPPPPPDTDSPGGARPPPPITAQPNAITQAATSPSTPSPPPVAHDNQKPPQHVQQGSPALPPPVAQQMMAGNLALSVVEKMVLSFDKADHFANDTVFLFQTGQFLFASRSILSVQCPGLAPWLFPKQDRFPVTVETITGQSTLYYVHPDEYVVDLKQRISLHQGYPVPDQNLIFGDKSLVNFTTLSSCGVTGETSLALVLVGSSAATSTTNYAASQSINPSLSIGHLSLGVRLEGVVGGGASVSPTVLTQQQQPVPPHICRMVHVHDVPYEGFKMLLVYLYCRDLLEPHNMNKVGAYVVCFILGEFFHLPCLSQICLTQMRSVLTADSALVLVRFSETVGSPLLHQLAVEFLKLHHTP